MENTPVEEIRETVNLRQSVPEAQVAYKAESDLKIFVIRQR